MLIGEVARRSGVSARMLRHYESLGLARPTGRTVAGYREYAEEDIRRIFHVESLRSLGLSLREVARALDDPGFTPAALVDDLISQTRRRIAAETELLTRLRRIDAAQPPGWEDVLHLVALLQALGSDSAAGRQRAALSAGGFPARRTPIGETSTGGLSVGGTSASGTSASGVSAGSPSTGGTSPGGTPADGTPGDGTTAGGTSASGVSAGSPSTDGTKAGGTSAGGASSGGTPAGGASAGGVALPAEALVEAILSEPDPIVAGALRWALARSDEGGRELLATSLESPDREIRRRAVRTLTKMPDGEATAVLRTALDDADVVVRRHAALALGVRGVQEAAPVLIDMVVEQANDVEAADALATLAADPALTDRIATDLISRLPDVAGNPAARGRLTQALADIPGPEVGKALTDLTSDPDRAVALTAAYLLTRRDSSSSAQPGKRGGVRRTGG